MTETPKIDLIPFEEGFPTPELPTIYCDGIANLAPSPHVVKLYLFRTDPDQAGNPKYKNQIVAQVIMPVTAFISSGLFFERSLKQFVEQGTITQKMIEDFKQIIQAEHQK